MASKKLFCECICALHITYKDLKECPRHQRIAIKFSYDIECKDRTYNSQPLFEYFFSQIDGGINFEVAIQKTVEHFGLI